MTLRVSAGLRRIAPFAAMALLVAPLLTLPTGVVAQQGRGAQSPAAQAPGRGATPAPAPKVGAPKSFRPTATVPNPRVTGPIAVQGSVGDGGRNYPWMASMHNLAAAGYVEEEFFVEGTARQFTTGENPTANGTSPYKSRILIRRPRDMSKFNGTILAEWQNVTAGYDLDAMWNGAYEHIIREGYVWAGISAQRVGLEGNAQDNGLKDWSPQRYGTLNIANDNFSYDIFAQGMQALDAPQGLNMIGGARPRTIIAMGASQSAGRLATYINSLHPQLGGPVDGYLIMIGGSLTRDDINVPVFRLYSETEIRAAPAGGMKPDSNIFRHWEVAGASHSTRRSSMNSGPSTRRDGAFRPPPSCTYPTFPRVPMNNVLGAVYDHLSRWARDGVEPPRAPLAQRNAQGIVRDARGNAASGGIRLAEFDPATARNSSDNGGSQFCNLYGRYEPFSDEVLAQLYPTHSAYVAAANARTAENLRAGYIVEADARISRLRAEQSIYGYGLPCAAACKAGQDLIDSGWYYLGIVPQRDAMMARLSTIVRNIAAGDKAGGSAEAAANIRARQDLERWIRDLSAMSGRGQISSTVLLELGTGANAVLRALPTS